VTKGDYLIPMPKKDRSPKAKPPESGWFVYILRCRDVTVICCTPSLALESTPKQSSALWREGLASRPLEPGAMPGLLPIRSRCP